ncbi:MAG: hypothetical protein E6K90_08150 [Thaumarchaeota archaeon]|nr:MAG: hypothetical protein E6K90_08150 [Nitrososphaerota archaeon]
MESADNARDARFEEIFVSFNESLMKYWESYVELQDQLYESLRAAREVSWLAATDTSKLREINQAQRELFARMPRRMDYIPLAQISLDYDSAASKIAELEATLSLEEEGCKKLEEAIAILKEKAEAMKEALRAAGR